MANQFLKPNEVVGYIRQPKTGSLIIQLEGPENLETSPEAEQWDVEQADATKNDSTVDVVSNASLTTPGPITVANALTGSLLPSYITAELGGSPAGAGSITIKGTVIDDLGAEIPDTEQVITYTSSTLGQRIQTALKIKDITSITVSSGFTVGTVNLRAYGKTWSAAHNTMRTTSAYTGLTTTNRTVSIFSADTYDYRIRKAQGTVNTNNSFVTATWEEGSTKLYR